MENVDRDIIVIGAGGRGLMAALVAAKKGARVPLLEKTTNPAAERHACSEFGVPSPGLIRLLELLERLERLEHLLCLESFERSEAIERLERFELVAQYRRLEPLEQLELFKQLERLQFKALASPWRLE